MLQVISIERPLKDNTTYHLLTRMVDGSIGDRRMIYSNGSLHKGGGVEKLADDVEGAVNTLYPLICPNGFPLMAHAIYEASQSDSDVRLYRDVLDGIRKRFKGDNSPKMKVA